MQWVFNTLSDNVKNPDLWFWLIKNVMFNMGDVFRNMYEAQVNLLKKEFTLYGRNIGRIVGDFFYVNPMQIFANE